MDQSLHERSIPLNHGREDEQLVGFREELTLTAFLLRASHDGKLFAHGAVWVDQHIVDEGLGQICEKRDHGDKSLGVALVAQDTTQVDDFDQIGLCEGDSKLSRHVALSTSRWCRRDLIEGAHARLLHDLSRTLGEDSDELQVEVVLTVVQAFAVYRHQIALQQEVGQDRLEPCSLAAALDQKKLTDQVHERVSPSTETWPLRNDLQRVVALQESLLKQPVAEIVVARCDADECWDEVLRELYYRRQQTLVRRVEGVKQRLRRGDLVEDCLRRQLEQVGEDFDRALLLQ